MLINFCVFLNVRPTVIKIFKKTKNLSKLLKELYCSVRERVPLEELYFSVKQKPAGLIPLART